MIRSLPFMVVAILLAAARPAGALAEGAMPDVTLAGHKATVVAVAFSPDGARLASAADDGTLKIWDLATRKELFAFDGAAANQNQLRFTPDGRTLVALGPANVLVFDLSTGKARKPIEVPRLPGGPAALDLSPDGKTLAVVGRGALRLFDLATGEPKGEYEVHPAYAVTAVAFSPDGTRLATASTDNTALLIDVASAKVLRTFDLKLKGQAVAFAAGGKSVVTFATDQTLRAFDAETGEATKLADVPALTTLAASADGKRLAVGGPGRGPWILSLPDGKRDGGPYDSEDRVKSAAISPDGKWLAGGGNGGAVFLWKDGK